MNKKEENYLIQIQEIRRKNNELWMAILRIAMETSPEVTKGLLAHISTNDSKVTELTKKLAGE